MESTSMISFIWDFLSEDVAIWDGLHSPMLSWLGSLAILVFFLWHAARLITNVSVVQRCYGRVWPTLKKLAVGRKTVGQEWQSIQALAESDRQLGRPLPRPSRVDLEDVQALDAAMRREPLLEQAWFHYRKTFVIERTAWFIEPRVFTTRSASEFFTQDVLAARLNLPFYHQLPSLITGLGLLFTFLAILIGLSTLQQRFLTMLDELFPRKTMEQMLENFNPAAQPATASTATPAAVPADLADRLAATVGDRLTTAVSAMTTTMQALAARGSGEAHPAYERLAEDMACAIKREMAVPLRELNQAIQELTRSVSGLQTAPRERDVPGSMRPRFNEEAPGINEESEPCDGAMAGLRWFASWHEQTPA